MSHRVISGQARGTRLKMVPGNTTRPIMDRAKEALFSILGNAVVDIRFLDLFAGTGSVGIEALSRGADFATFVDLEKLALKTVQENLKATKFTEKAEVIRADAFAYLKRENIRPYGMVYIAPPQYKEFWQRALKTLDENPQILEPDALVIVQIDPSEQESVTLKHLSPYKEKTYGKTLLWFFEYLAEE